MIDAGFGTEVTKSLATSKVELEKSNLFYAGDKKQQIDNILNFNVK